jgi:hypothetical protein
MIVLCEHPLSSFGRKCDMALHGRHVEPERRPPNPFLFSHELG